MSARASFHAYGLRIDSALPLGLKASGTAPARAPRVSLVSCARTPKGLPWHALWTHPNGKAWLSCARTPKGDWLSFTGYADFFLPARGARIDVRPHSDAEPSALAHLFLDSVLPLYLSRRGTLVLHASAVQFGRKAVAFAGPSGCGKSTLAAALCAKSKATKLISDDALTLRIAGVRGQGSGVRASAVMACPAYGGLRLWPDSAERFADGSPDLPRVAEYSPKYRLALPHAFKAAPVALSCIYLLEESTDSSDTPRVEPIQGASALVSLAQYIFRLLPASESEMRREFAALRALIRHVRVSRLTRPKRWDALPLTLDVIRG